MHESSFNWMTTSVAKYLDKEAKIMIADIGSFRPRKQRQTYREIFSTNPNWTYIGADIAKGDNVDVVVDPHYQWKNFCDGQFDVVISGQVMEHVDAPWIFAQSLARICRKGGLCFVTAPSRWKEHRQPLDCWRILSDGMRSVMTKYAPFKEIECRTVNVDDMHGDTYFIGRKI